MKKDVIIGIDTSNYTTSVALMSTDGELISKIKRPLPVKAGECGLRQSDAVFAHVKNIPSAMEEARGYLSGIKPVAVAVSTRPRNVDGSYMPCFLSGVAVAESIGAANGIPLYRYSHQCGHVMAAIYSSGRCDLLEKENFCAFHVSGGTTEVLRVTPTDNAFLAEQVGGTKDLNAGQVIDRVGVFMGLPFPAGAHIEELALKNTAKIPSKKISVSDMSVNLSGLENMAKSLYEASGDKALTSAFVLDYIGKSLCSLAEAYEEKYGSSEFVFAGGVMSNSIIKGMLAHKIKASFAEPRLSSDNAVGIAALAVREFTKK